MPHLIVFCHLRWSFVYQRPQHLLSRLAKHFPVTFVEEPVKVDGEAYLEVSEPEPGVTVLRPHTPIDAAGFHDDQLRQMGPMLATHMRQAGIDDFIAWFYTPMALPLLKELKPRGVVYDCMDELTCFKGAPAELKQREAELIALSDVVLTGGPSLYEAKRSLHPNVICLPSAVDAVHFAPGSAANIEGALPAACLQGSVQAPRLGFFGVIDERLDIDLVQALADADPRWQVVMVGPVVKIDPAQLPQRPNIHWLGQQSYALLPALVAGWDVCLLPFAQNDATRFISPTKTLEYMAAEKPVVSTPVRDVALLYGHAVNVAGCHLLFIEACRRALSESEEAKTLRVAAMKATVARHSWSAAAQRVRQEIRKLLSCAASQESFAAASVP